MAGLRHVGAEGYFDVEVTCEGPFAAPPKSCFLDGVQVATGATLGKRNLACVEADHLLVRVRNTRTGDQVEIRPTPKLWQLLHSFKPKPKAEQVESDHHHDEDSHQDEIVEALARKIAAMPETELLTAKSTRD
jgi:formylmethanofuran dehydrogenase subunit E